MRLVRENDGSGAVIWTLLTVLTSVCNVGQSSFTKLSSAKGQTTGVMRINAVKVGTAFLIFFLISFYKLQLHLPTILFAVGYGVLLFGSNLFGYLALMRGSMAISSLIVSYSVLIPCIFGIAFLNESVTVLRIFGLVLLLVSMYFLRRNLGGDAKKSGRWLMYVVLTFLCNGVGSVLQKLHQTAYPGSYCNEFLLCALSVNLLLFTVIAIGRREKASGGTLYAMLAGALMGAANYLTLFLSAKVSASVLFPMITVISALLNVTVSTLVFKDKFTLRQGIGILLGVVSVLLIK